MKLKMIRYLVVFIVFMLICTVVSRGIYAYEMPQVNVGKAEERRMEHKIEKEGVLEPSSERAIVLEEGLCIRKICVEPGKKIKKGTLLFQLECSELEKKINELAEEIRVANQRLKDLQMTEKMQDRAERTMKNRVREDVKSVKNKQKENIRDAKKEYVSACGELSAYPDYESYLDEEKSRNTEYQTLKAEAEKPKATQEDKEAYNIFCATFEAQIKKDWQDGRHLLEKDVKKKKEAIKSAREKGKKAVKAAKKQGNREVEDTMNSQTENNGDVFEQKNTIRKKEMELAVYEKYKEADGEVRSEMEGTIQKINVSVGEQTSEGAAVILADTTKGWKFQAVLSEEERNYIHAGDTMTLVFREGEIKIPDVAVGSVRRKSDGTYQLSASVKGQKLELGESGKMQFTADSGVQECCVPLSGLYAGGTDTYVLVLTEKETFLGKEYYVEKRKVVVKDKNDEYAVLADEPVGKDEKIVVLCDWEISPGDQVRMLEEDV